MQRAFTVKTFSYQKVMISSLLSRWDKILIALHDLCLVENFRSSIGILFFSLFSPWDFPAIVFFTLFSIFILLSFLSPSLYLIFFYWHPIKTSLHLLCYAAIFKLAINWNTLCSVKWWDYLQQEPLWIIDEGSLSELIRISHKEPYLNPIW